MMTMIENKSKAFTKASNVKNKFLNLY
jgi:hypothetical protein